MSVIRDFEKIKFDLSFSGTYSISISQNSAIKYDRHRVESIEELYDMLTSEAVFEIVKKEELSDSEVLDNIDHKSWDIYEYISFIMGIEKYYDVDISDEIAEKFKFENLIPILKREDKLNSLGI